MQKKDRLTILVMGKGGVGKSSTVNSIIGERAVTVSAFQVPTIIARICRCLLDLSIVLLNCSSLLFLVRSTKTYNGFTGAVRVHIEHY